MKIFLFLLRGMLPYMQAEIEPVDDSSAEGGVGNADPPAEPPAAAEG